MGPQDEPEHVASQQSPPSYSHAALLFAASQVPSPKKPSAHVVVGADDGSTAGQLSQVTGQASSDATPSSSTFPSKHRLPVFWAIHPQSFAGLPAMAHDVESWQPSTTASAAHSSPARRRREAAAMGD